MLRRLRGTYTYTHTTAHTHALLEYHHTIAVCINIASRFLTENPAPYDVRAVGESDAHRRIMVVGEGATKGISL